MRNCTKNAGPPQSLSDRPPSRMRLSEGAAPDVDVLANSDEYQFIIDHSNSGFEFVEGSTGVKGRLKQCRGYWESTIDASNFVLDIISYGYKLPFSSISDSCHLRNNRSALNHPVFLKTLSPTYYLMIV